MLPPIYIINLDSNPDRLAKCSHRLAMQNINFERVQGVLGAALTKNEITKHYDDNLNRSKYYTPLTTGQIGCYFSHRKAWRKIAEGDAPFGIVMEDDFLLLSSLKLSIATIQAFDFSWDVIKLAAYQSRDRKIKFSHQVSNKMHVAVHFKPMSGGAATAISKAAAQRLLDETNKFGRPVDTDIQHFWEKGIKVLSLMPYPIAQDMTFESTISAKKESRKKYFWKRKWQQLHTGIINRREVTKQVNKLKVTLGIRC